MSKYQEALDRLAIHSIRSEDVKMLQELVDKEKPIPLLFVEEDLKQKIIRYYQFRIERNNLSKAVYLHDIKGNQIILKKL